jgi:hypothetical protein
MKPASYYGYADGHSPEKQRAGIWTILDNPRGHLLRFPFSLIPAGIVFSKSALKTLRDAFQALGSQNL